MVDSVMHGACVWQVCATLVHDRRLRVLVVRLGIVSAAFPDAPPLHPLSAGHEWR